MIPFRSFVPLVCVCPPPPSAHHGFVAGFRVSDLGLSQGCLGYPGSLGFWGIALTPQMALGGCHPDGVTSVDHEIGNLCTYLGLRFLSTAFCCFQVMSVALTVKLSPGIL